jgi:hypothetical protein
MPTYTLTRHVPIESHYDLVVTGGGPAGVAAAVSAARLGAKVMLVEATGCMGGMGTSGLVTAFDPMANGERMLVGGLQREIVETLFNRGELGPRVTRDTFSKDYMKWTPFNTEAYKRLLDELTVDAGVEVRFFTRLIDVDVDQTNRQVRGVILHNIEGYRCVRAKAFVDATGDAVLADLAGVDCREAGRDTPRIMPATLASLFTGFDVDQVDWRAQQEGLRCALADGHFTQPDRHLPGMSATGRHIGYLNGGHLFDLNALRCKDLTEGVMLGRRLAKEYMEFYRKYVPGFEKIEHVTTASLVGVRESRRIVGEYELTVDDYLARRQFPDQIGLFNKFIDIHPYDCSDEEWSRFRAEKDDAKWRLQPGECFGIPYGIIVPKGWTNLWVAGRCNSSDEKVHGSIRVMPAAAMMGEAAGAAAVQSINTGQAANELNTRTLVETLRKQNAYLPQEDLSATMTR